MFSRPSALAALDRADRPESGHGDGPERQHKGAVDQLRGPGQTGAVAKGKPVVVYVWAHYCGHCKSEGIPHLVKMHEKYGKDGLVVLTVTMDEDNDASAEERAATRGKIVGRRRNCPSAPTTSTSTRTRPPLAFSDGVPRVFVFNRDNQYPLSCRKCDKPGTRKGHRRGRRRTAMPRPSRRPSWRR